VWPPPTSQSTYGVNRSYSLAVYISVRRRRKSHYTRNELRRVFAAKTAERNSECIGRRTEGPKRTPVASASNLCWLIVAAQTGRDRHTIRTDRQTPDRRFTLFGMNAASVTDSHTVSIVGPAQLKNEIKIFYVRYKLGYHHHHQFNTHECSMNNNKTHTITHTK